jgi:hypothetical protein
LTQNYNAFTLVDITETNLFNSKTTDTKSYNQQQNLNTLIQLIGMRSQPINIAVTKLEAQDVVKFSFGKQFTGLHTVWKFSFVSEHTDVYKHNDNDVYFLKEDSDGAAFISKLDETAKFKHSTFETKNKNSINLYFLKV